MDNIKVNPNSLFEFNDEKDIVREKSIEGKREFNVNGLEVGTILNGIIDFDLQANIGKKYDNGGDKSGYLKINIIGTDYYTFAYANIPMNSPEAKANLTLDEAISRRVPRYQVVYNLLMSMYNVINGEKPEEHKYREKILLPDNKFKQIIEYIKGKAVQYEVIKNKFSNGNSFKLLCIKDKLEELPPEPNTETEDNTFN